MDALFVRAEQLKTALQYDSAALLYRQLAPQYHDQSDWERYLDCQAQLAFCLWMTHRGEQAMVLSERMIEAGCALLGPDHLRLADFHTVIGNVLADRRTQSDYDRCIQHYERALAIKQSHYGKRHPAVASAYERLGIAHYLIDDYSGAIPLYRRAISMLEAPTVENAADYSFFHTNLGLNYYGMGYYRQALEQYRKGKYFLREVLGREDGRMVKASINIAEALIQLGDMDEATFELEEVRHVVRQLEPTSKIIAYYWGCLGAAYVAKEAYPVAIDYFEQCLPFWNPDNRDDTNARILEHSRIGACYLALDQVDRAMEHFGQAYAALDAHYDPGNFTWVTTLMNLGRGWQRKGELKAAEGFYERALAIAVQRMGERHPTVASIHIALSRLSLETDQAERAYQWACRAENALIKRISDSRPTPNVDEISDLLSYVEVLNWRGAIKVRQYEASERLEDLQQAREAFRQSLAYSDSLKTGLLSVTAVERAQKQICQLSEKALYCLFLLWQRTHDEKYLAEALLYFEKSKSDWLRTSAREWLARRHAELPADMIEKELALRAQLAHYRNLYQADHKSSPSGTDSKAAVWQQRFFEARRRLDSLSKQIAQQYPDYYPLKRDDRVATLDQVKTYTREHQSRLITYFWGRKQLYAITIGPQAIDWVRLEEPDSVHGKLLAFQATIDLERHGWSSDSVRLAGYRSFVKLGYDLYSTLIQPLLKKTPPNRLILIPDGPLGQLAFQVLPTDSPTEQSLAQINYRTLPYLIRRAPIQYEHSATLLFQPSARSGDHSAYLGFAPSYREAPPLAAFTLGKSSEEVGLAAVNRIWDNLPHAEEEVKETAAKLGGRAVLGKAATESAFRRQAVDAQVLHLAGHAFSHESEPDYSALVFSADPDRPANGQLHAYELYNLSLQAELAVLSACHTGAGLYRTGEGIMSLSRAFRHAGCPSVMMSLWAANDFTTKTVVVDFFDHLSANQSKSQALRSASIDFLDRVKNDRLTHPFYWGGFVVVGKDSPIEVAPKSRGPRRWFFAAGLLVFVAIALYLRRLFR